MACAKAQILFYFHTALYVLPVSHGFFLKKVEEKQRRQKCAQKVLCPGYTNLWTKEGECQTQTCGHFLLFLTFISLFQELLLSLLNADPPFNQNGK